MVLANITPFTPWVSTIIKSHLNIPEYPTDSRLIRKGVGYAKLRTHLHETTLLMGVSRASSRLLKYSGIFILSIQTSYEIVDLMGRII